LEVRSLFKKIFGGKQSNANGYKGYEMISGSTSTFYAWDGNLFQSDIVRSCIRPKANAVGKLNAKHVRGNNEDMQINPEPYIREILQNPNPYMSMQDFLLKMTFQRELNHNAFAYIKRDKEGYPEEIYPMPSSSVDLLEKDGEAFAKFQFRTGKYIIVPYEDIIHLRKDFSSHDFYGETGNQTLKPLMEVINTTDQGVVNAVKNSTIVKWIMMFKAVLQPKDKEKEIKDFTKNYLAIESESGGVASTDPRYELKQVDQKSYVPNAAQMKESIQRLYAYFGVNEKIVQNKFTEDEWNSFFEAEIEPILIQLSNAFTNAFFTKRERGFGNKIIFEATNLAYASMNTKLGLVALVDRGILTPNEHRRILNLPPIVGGDLPVRRLDTVTVEENSEGGEEDEEETDDR
jgi:HK97 family phage portal protein